MVARKDVTRCGGGRLSSRGCRRLDSIVAGLVKMTGGGEPAIPKTIYDLSIPSDFAPPKQPLKEQLVMPTPTAILMLDTQRFLLAPSKEIPGFSSAQWADSIPKMLQVNLFQQRRKLDKPDPASAVGAFDDAFGSIATELITWTAGALLALP
jgi:ABC-type uncharacterized transport system auxiliary subunit